MALHFLQGLFLVDFIFGGRGISPTSQVTYLPSPHQLFRELPFTEGQTSTVSWQVVHNEVEQR